MQRPQSWIVGLVLKDQMAVWDHDLRVSSHRIVCLNLAIPETYSIADHLEVVAMEMHSVGILRKRRIVDHDSDDLRVTNIVDLIRIE